MDRIECRKHVLRGLARGKEWCTDILECCTDVLEWCIDISAEVSWNHEGGSVRFGVDSQEEWDA